MPAAKPEESLKRSLFAKIDWAGRVLDIDSDFIEKELKRFKFDELAPDRIRVPMDNGGYESIKGVVVLHHLPYSDDQPYKGGVRMGENILTDTLKGLSAGTTIKWGVFDIPFGGAKAGIILPRPKNTYSPQETSRIMECFTDVFTTGLPIIGPHGYVPATDMGTTEWEMDSIHIRYNKITGGVKGAAVTGRSVRYGGLPIRKDAIGLGGIIVLEQLMQTADLPKLSKVPPVILQGTGQVGRGFLRFMKERNYLLVGVCNAKSAVFNPGGIDIDLLPAGYDDPFTDIVGEHCTPAQLLEKPCDILVPAAVENAVTKENAERIQAKILLELANHPVTDEAEAMLTKEGVYIIPDLLANAMGGGASFIEWSNSFAEAIHRVDIPRLNREAEQKIAALAEYGTMQVLDYAKKYETDLRRAAVLKSMNSIVPESKYKHKAQRGF